MVAVCLLPCHKTSTGSLIGGAGAGAGSGADCILCQNMNHWIYHPCCYSFGHRSYHLLIDCIHLIDDSKRQGELEPPLHYVEDRGGIHIHVELDLGDSIHVWSDPWHEGQVSDLGQWEDFGICHIDCYMEVEHTVVCEPWSLKVGDGDGYSSNLLASWYDQHWSVHDSGKPDNAVFRQPSNEDREEDAFDYYGHYSLFLIVNCLQRADAQHPQDVGLHIHLRSYYAFHCQIASFQNLHATAPALVLDHPLSRSSLGK